MGRVRLNTRIRFGDDVGEVTEFLDEPNSGLAVLEVRGRSYTVPAALLEAALDESLELIGVERFITEETGMLAFEKTRETAVVEAAEKWAEEHRALGAATTKHGEANMEERATHAKLVLEAFGRDMPRTEVIHLKDGATVTVEATAFQYRARLEEAPAEVETPRDLVEKQGVRICKTWNRKDLSIVEMLETFPFGDVLLAMDKAGWKWRGATPTFEQIKEKAGELLRGLDGGLGQAVTGGLGASRWGDEYTLRFPSLSGEEKDLTGAGESA